MSIDVLVNESRVVKEAKEFCKWFVFQEDVYNITKEFMKDMCLRDDVFDVMMWQLACGSFDGLKGEGNTEEGTPVRTAMMREGMGIVARPEVAEAVKHQFFVFPVVDTLTLGLYSMVTPGSETFAQGREKVVMEPMNDDQNKNDETQP